MHRLVKDMLVLWINANEMQNLQFGSEDDGAKQCKPMVLIFSTLYLRQSISNDVNILLSVATSSLALTCALNVVNRQMSAKHTVTLGWDFEIGVS